MFLNAFTPYSCRKLAKTETGRGIAWTATLQRDGTDVAKIVDAGDGDSPTIDFFLPAEADRFDHFVSNLPDTAARFLNLKEDDGSPTTDLVVAAIADLTETSQRLKARCKRATVFVTTAMAPGEVGVLKVQFTPKVKAALERQHGERLVAVLNEVL